MRPRRRRHAAFGRALVGEGAGTLILVLFGTGSVASAVLTGAQVGLWQVAVVWGFGVALAIYSSAAASGAHLNPAVSLAFALWRPAGFAWGRLLPCWGAQLLGAVLAGCAVAALFWPVLLRFEAAKGLVRGAPGSELSAMVFGRYSPNPALFGTDAAARAEVDRPRILFVCVRNAARSQMAAAFAAHVGEGRIEAHSAGSAPAEEVDPAVVAATREAGVDVPDAFPKPLADAIGVLPALAVAAATAVLAPVWLLFSPVRDLRAAPGPTGDPPLAS